MNLHLSSAPHIHTRASTRVLMLNVVIALLPCAAAGIWYFGLDAALVLLVCMATSVLSELVWQKLAKKPVRVGDLSALVTGLILGLNLPSTAPLWMAAIGSVIAVMLVKQLFGGIGDNFMNPALTARAILLASWPVYMTTFVSPTGFSGVDAVTAATPLKTGMASMSDLFMGNIPGCIGEVSKLMILIGLAYLLITKTVSWRIPVVMVASAALFSWILGKDVAYAVLSGGLLFGAVFMATDYVTCPMTGIGQIIFAFGAGMLVALIRSAGMYPEGVTFAILIMNIVTPLIDKYVKPRVYGHGKEAKANG
ncbi:MAG: RnfABCDGE type electron transport complex subunit D [Clostridia bacterium]|nr:RnfABCDGE type electron transport complex subunit D [Clostridia bacterium]